MTPKKYKKNETETKNEFVTRIVVNENRPMTASDVVNCIDRRTMKHIDPKNIHANLSDTVSKYDSLCKKRMENDKGQMRVHYYPCDMDVAGEDIPIPAFNKQGGNTFVNDPLPADGAQVPTAVAVAEKVLADLGASDDDDAWSPKPTAEEVAKWGEDYEPTLGVTRIVKVEGGFVEMQNDIVLGFTTSIVGHLAEALFVEHHVAEQKIIEALNSVNTLGRAELVRALRNLVVNQ